MKRPFWKRKEAMKKRALFYILAAAILTIAVGLFLLNRDGADRDIVVKTPAPAVAATEEPPAGPVEIGGKSFDSESETVIVHDAAAEELRAALVRLYAARSDGGV